MLVTVAARRCAGPLRTRKEVTQVTWITPDFEEVETEAEVTAYAGHW
jgi:coenzyme PQQ precursor peptide PqqA